MYYKTGFFCSLVLAVGILSGCGGGGGGAGSPIGYSLGSESSSRASGAPDLAPPVESYTIHMGAFGRLGANPKSAARRYEVYTGQQHMSEIRAAHSRSLVLAYRYAAGAADNTLWGDEPAGYNWLLKNHPEWILRDDSGKELRYGRGTSYWVAVDPAIKEYQHLWAQQAIAFARSLGADGVMIDNVTTDWDWSLSPKPRSYSGGLNTEQAMDSFVEAVTAEIRAAGLYVIVNGSLQAWNSGIWNSWMNTLDGRIYEPPGGCGNAQWETESQWLDLMASYEMYPDKLYIHYVPNPQMYPDKARFAIASYLLWQGRNSYLGVNYSEDPELPYDPLMDIDIGKPTGRCQKISDMTYRRTYERGEVFLNASSSQSTVVKLNTPGKDLNGNPVPEGAKILGPREGVILTRPY